MGAQQGFDLHHLIESDYQIQVEADQRIDIRVHSLPADDAVADAVSFEQTDQAGKEIRVIHGYRFPKRRCPHAFPMIARQREAYGFTVIAGAASIPLDVYSIGTTRYRYTIPCDPTAYPLSGATRLKSSTDEGK